MCLASQTIGAAQQVLGCSLVIWQALACQPKGWEFESFQLDAIFDPVVNSPLSPVIPACIVRYRNMERAFAGSFAF